MPRTDHLVRDCILLLDGEGRVREANPAASLLLAGGAPLVGRLFAELIHPLLARASGPPLGDPATLLAGGDERQGEVPLYIGGRSREARYRIARMDDGWALVLELWERPDPIGAFPASQRSATLAKAVESAYEAVVITDPTGIIEYVNPAFERVTGYHRDEAIGFTPRILKSGMHSAVFYEDLWGTILAGKVWQGDLINRRKDGSVYYDHASISPVFDAEGRIVNFVSVKQDITERKLTEQALTEQREQLRMMTDNIPAMIAYVDHSEKFHFVNRAYEDWLDRGAADILGHNLAEILGPDGYEGVRGQVTKALAGETVNFERNVSDADGRERFQSVTYIPHRDDRSGKIRGFFALATDITERKASERELRWNHRLLDLISAAQSQFIVDADYAQVFSRLLDNLLTLTGSAYGFIGSAMTDDDGADYLQIHAITDFSGNPTVAPFVERYAPPDMAFRKLDNLFGRVVTDGRPVISNDPAHDERRAGLPPGHPPLASFMGIPVMKGEKIFGEIGIANRPGGYSPELLRALEPFILTCANIMEAMALENARRAVEGDLRESRDSLAKAQRIAHVGNWDWNIVTDRLFWSEEMYRIFGLDPGGAPGDFEKFITHIHPDDLSRVRKAINEAINETGHYHLDHRIVRPDGTERIVTGQAEVFYDERETAVRMVGTISDITLRKRLENELREQTKKLKELDSFKNRLMSIVSHDLRSPLTSNIGLLALLTRPGKEGLTDRQANIVTTVERSLRHQLSLVENLLELSRVYRGNIQMQPEVVRPGEIMQASAAMLSQMASEKGVDVDETPAAVDGIIRVDRNRMIQVVNNLLANAIKFSETGSRVTMSVDRADAGRVALTVIDRGIGIAAKRLENLFDLASASTTLGTVGEKGTGLGLSICQELTALNGGEIEIVSTEGEGTTVRLLFALEPASDRDAEESALP
jgi:PAS domain S-box-containing protein